MSKTVEISRELVERLIERLAKAQMFKETDELRATLVRAEYLESCKVCHDALAATVVERQNDALSKGFHTTQSGGGEYAINIGFRSLADMQSADKQLRDLLRARHTSPPAPVAVVQHPFADKVIRKLQRFQECTEDGQGADIGRHWFDLLTQLGLLNRVQRSPALWEITQQGEDCLDKVKEMNQ